MMERLAWISIGTDVLGALLMIGMLLSSGQDAAGRGMLFLPILLLLALAGLSYWLLQSAQTGWALAVAGVPALIVLLVAAFTLKDAF